MNKPIKKDGLIDKVSEALRKEIRTLRAGSRLDSMGSLATQYSVSEPTIRHALLMLAKEGFVEIRHGSGTFVKEQSDDRPIGVLMEIDFSEPDVSFFWRRVTQLVRTRLAAQGVRTRFYAGFCQPYPRADGEIWQEFAEDVASNQLRGVIVPYINSDGASFLRGYDIPVVSCFPRFENYVSFDLATAVRVATLRLLEAGRRKLAFMDWGTLRPRPDYADPYAQAFTDALAEYGLQPNDRWFRGEFHPNQPGAGWEEFREIWTGSAEKPDGLVVADDVLFQGIARAISELGIKVPEQLMIATHATPGAREDYPFPLWRMQTDPDVVAKAQVDMLMALLQGESVTQRQIILPVQLVAPNSTVVDNTGMREAEPVTQEGSS